MKIINKILGLSLLFLFIQCKKDHHVLGVNVQPDDDTLKGEYVEYPIFAFTANYDSIPNFRDRYKFLGSNNDPYFGRVDVGLYLNANMSVSDVNFTGDDFISSEIILAIDNKVFAGDTSAQITFSIFPLDSALNVSRVYYTNNVPLYNPNPLPTFYTGSFSTMNNQGVLRIPVDSAFASQMMYGTSYLQNNEIFQTRYKGFYIAASAGQGEGIIYKVDLENDLSGLYLRYKNTKSPDDTSFRFTFNGVNSVKFNTVKYDYSTAPAALVSQLSGDTSSGGSLFLKGMGVTRVKVNIPAIKMQSDSFNFAVNRAEVIFKPDVSYNNGGKGHNIPLQLALLPISVKGRDTFALDQLNVTDNVRYNGIYDPANNQYVFNIARHVQAIFKGSKRNNGFYLYVADPSKALAARRDNFIERVILAGTSDEALKPRFKLSFTKFRKD